MHRVRQLFAYGSTPPCSFNPGNIRHPAAGDGVTYSGGRNALPPKVHFSGLHFSDDDVEFCDHYKANARNHRKVKPQKLRKKLTKCRTKQGRTIILMSHDGRMVNGPHTVLDLNEKPIPSITKVAPEAPNPEPGEGQASQANINAAALAGAKPETSVVEPEPNEAPFEPADDRGIGVIGDQSRLAIDNGERAKND